MGDRTDREFRKLEGDGDGDQTDPVENLEVVLDILDETEDELDDYRLGLCHAARMLLYELYRLLRDGDEGTE